jgi:NAD(P)-dependent dehydrogenase (short-subunit alcohol dehydrogenase family)
MDVVLITGANKGIGFEVARQLAVQGSTVLLGARDATRGQAAVDALHAQGLHAVQLVVIDVTSQESIHKAAAEIEQRYGVLDVLINNAAIIVDQASPSQATQSDLRTTFDTNFFGAIAVAQAFLPLLRKSAHARLINVSSGLGSIELHSNPNSPYFAYNILGYCASKTALNAFTVMLANELRDSGIKVNTVDPGYTATDLNNNSGPQTIAEGSEAIISLATAGPDSQTGAFVDRHGTLPW